MTKDLQISAENFKIVNKIFRENNFVIYKE